MKLDEVRLSRLGLRIATVSLAVAVALWLCCALLYEDAGRAWNVLAGLESPFGSDGWASAAGVCLSVVGYLLVPVLVGLIVTVGLDVWIRDQRRPLAEVKRELDDLITARLGSVPMAVNAPDLPEGNEQ